MVIVKLLFMVYCCGKEWLEIGSIDSMKRLDVLREMVEKRATAQLMSEPGGHHNFQPYVPRFLKMPQWIRPEGPY